MKTKENNKATTKMQTAKAASSSPVSGAEKSETKTPANLVELTGHLGKDPIVSELDGGRKKAYFTMATNIPYTTAQGAEKEETHWHSLVAWGTLAEQVGQFLRKGDKVNITGRINNRAYTDKSGVKKTFTEIVMSSLQVYPKQQAA
ncbi:MAG: single-stranded DNA-binding protein [Bacteroidia bacterium]|nr:single-stranded DNA-binding protein [Bacteroidia bacterium]